MDENELREVESILSYQFQNKALLIQAFTRSSYAKEHNTMDNEVLEFLGDTVLGQVVVSRLINHFTIEGDEGLDSKVDENTLTDYKIKLVNKKILAARIDKLDLVTYLLVGKGDEKIKVTDKDSVKEDLFEAIVGAVTIDTNYNWDKLNDLIDVMLDIDEFFGNNFQEAYENSIRKLQTWFQKKGYGVPNYHFEESYNYSGNLWHCHLFLNDNRFEGKADTKIEAKKICAQNVMNYLTGNNLCHSMKDEIKEPRLNNAINQLQELSQKGYFTTPVYEFEEEQREGEIVWTVRVDINEYDFYFESTGSSKKEAKKQAAFRMLEEILKLD